MTRWLATLSTSAESDDSTQLRMKRMNFISRTTLFLLLFLSLVFIAAPCATGKLYAQSDPDEDREAGTELTPEAVRDSIEGGVEFLRKQQSTRGSWKEYPGYEPGTTALCALALLTAGLDKEDPTVAKALEYLRGFSPMKQNLTYPISLQTMVFCLADPDEYRSEIEANVAWLVERQMKTSNEHRGGWSYIGSNQSAERADNSNSQFALLALFEAELAGVTVDESVWLSAEDYWLRMQNDDGSWGYRSSALNAEGFPSGYGTGSMTCAGISALAICSGVREAARARIEGERAFCCQDVDDEIATRISRGLNWLGKHFSARTNPGRAAGSESYFYYYLYGLERVGRLTANRFVGQSDWYREGAEALLRRKGVLSNFWSAQKDFDNNSSVSTSFALLFLSKGRWPTLASKLRYGEENYWNEHPNDLAHLTERVEEAWKQKMVWQTIDAAKATPDDLLQSPILLVNGTLDPTPKEPKAKQAFVANLRAYLEQGGFILAEALDGDLSFETGFRSLIEEVLQGENAEFTLLDSKHPIWFAESLVPAEFLRPVYGVDFGCRTSVILVPAYKPERGADGAPPSVFGDRPSLSCLWEAAVKRQRTSSGQNLPSTRALQEQEAAFTLGLNICAYATNRQVKFKDEIPADVANELEKHKEERNSLFAGILDCGAGASCAPRAIPNLMRQIRAKLGAPTQLYVPHTSLKNDDVFDYPTLFMHGRNEFSFTDYERERLRLFIERGGFLFVNAICASQKFETSFFSEIRETFPDEELTDVPADDPLFTGKYGGFKIEKLQYRTRSDAKTPDAQVVARAPLLKGIMRDGRWVILYSPYDVSCALEDAAASNCEGLTTKSAFSLATNILFYAMESLASEK